MNLGRPGSERAAGRRPATWYATTTCRLCARLREVYRDLPVRRKTLLLPAFAGVALLVVLAVNVTLGAAADAHLRRVERHDLPALLVSRDLEVALGAVQRRLQDAVAARDADGLAEADSLRDIFLTHVARNAANPVVGGAAADGLRSTFAAYYATARGTAARLMAGAPADEMGDALGAMSRQYAALRDALAGETRQRQAHATAEFAAARALQRRATLATGGVTVTCVLLLVGLAVAVSQSLTRPLRHAVAVAHRLADGDVSAEVRVNSHDEIGQLLGAMRAMVGALRGTAHVAERIAEGDVSTPVVPRSASDAFGHSFAHMSAYLGEMAGVADEIARGNLAVHVAPRGAGDRFGAAFEGMVANLRAGARENRELAELLAAARARLEHLLASSPAIIYGRELGEGSGLTYVSPNLATQFGHDPAVWLADAAAWGAALHPEDAPAVRAALAGAAGGGVAGRHLTQEYRLRHADGGYRWVRDELRVAAGAAGAAASECVGYLVDITERKALEQQLAHQAYHDPLTGLANRALFRDRVERALARAARAGGGDAGVAGVAVLFLDLDDFKTVNDSLGHAAGDALLVGVAARLLHATRGADTVARLGGDEFAVLLQDVPTEAHATVVAARILAALAAQIDAAGTPVTVGASVGVARASADDGPDELLRNADVAMYLAKRRGKRHYEVFAPAMHAAAVARLELEADLRHALARDEFRLVYQPIVALPSGAVTGFEALLRWHHPTRELVPPNLFIPVAEETALVVPLGRWVLDEACRQAIAWEREQGEQQRRAPHQRGAEPGGGSGPPLVMSVNVSGRQLAEGDRLVADVRAALAASGLAPACLQLEITETVMMHDTEAALAVLHALKALGVRLAIDDFGTGYSSLSYLERFPVDVLKIDKAFVDGLGAGGEESPLAEAIVRIGHTLGLKVVAEGIETPAQAARLAEFRCAYGQGYLFARPLPPDAAGRLLAERHVSSWALISQSSAERTSGHVAAAPAASRPGGWP